MEIKGEQIMFLLGAGASVDAKIPISNEMVNEIEKLINQDSDWKPYRDLYNYLKSSIYYSEGIFGKFGEPFNVEKLLIVISEIEKRDRNIVYPFIGSWNIRLLDLAGSDFKRITEFKRLIRKKLNSWVRVKDYVNDASYYNGFINLSREIGNIIKVFTFNYDLCFERIVGKELEVETGFNKTSRDWHYSNFENDTEKNYFLYKLHGSIDWYSKNDEPNKFFQSDEPEDNPELIFGIPNKLDSIDPYFFYTSELRKSTLEDAKLIVAIGYSFSDDYANKILTQALNSRDELRILSVGYSELDEKVVIKNIKERLELKSDKQIKTYRNGAKEFISNVMTKEYLSEFMSNSEEVPF
jgi:hypothetical protein